MSVCEWVCAHAHLCAIGTLLCLQGLKKLTVLFNIKQSIFLLSVHIHTFAHTQNYINILISSLLVLFIKAIQNIVSPLSPSMLYKFTVGLFMVITGMLLLLRFFFFLLLFNHPAPLLWLNILTSHDTNNNINSFNTFRSNSVSE